MTSREACRKAANELVNCEATSDANADEQLALATALRALADRLDAEIAAAEHDARMAPHITAEERAWAQQEVLARLDAPLPSGRVMPACETCGGDGHDGHGLPCLTCGGTGRVMPGKETT